MTDKNYTHLLIISDRSGSMGAPVYKTAYGVPSWTSNSIDFSTVASNMEHALGSLFEEQALIEGKCLVDFVEFDNDSNIVYEDREISKATASIIPRGTTALYDAIGKAVTNLGIKLAALPEVHRPGHVIVAIVTDGYENASKEWTTKSRIKELIEHQTNKYGWVFTFLGANMDAVSEAQDYGITRDSALTWSVENAAPAGASLSNYVTTTRSGVVASYSDEDRKAAKS